MRRGEIWTVAGAPDYASKPRPAVIVQDDRFDTDSVTVCPLTTDPTDAPMIRLPIAPAADNGLTAPSRLMVDKITIVRRTKLGERVGALDDATLVALNRSMIVFLGIASGE